VLVTSDFKYMELLYQAQALYEALLSVQSTYAGWHPDREAADLALRRYEEGI
jgi:hypothetical protein